MPQLQALVVIPTYNERENIGPLIDGIFAHSSPVHVLVVDDNSPDGTAEVVRGHQRKYGAERLHLLVRKEGKAGRGSACMEGFSWAQRGGYQAVIEMDADLSHDPRDIPRFLEALRNADVVIGSKYLRESHIIGWEWYRKLLSRAANTYARLILRMPVRDYTNGYRCYGLRALALLPELQVDGKGFTVIPQLSYQLYLRGMRIIEIPIVFTNRRHGKSNMSLREIVESAFTILRIRSHFLHLHISQFLKFAIIGGSNTLLDLFLLALFVEVSAVPLRLAVVLADSLAITNAFFMNRWWTFRRKGFGGQAGHIAVQYVKFLLVYGTSFLLGISITLFLAEIVGVWYIFAKICAIPPAAIWNYCWLHFGVFRKNGKAC